MNDFEDLLQRQPLRSVPPDWRTDILSTASTAAAAPRPSSPAWWRLAFWPTPYAWGALAAVWLLILGLNFASQPTHSRASDSSFSSSPEYFTALAEQRRLLEELTRPPATRPTPAQQNSPTPASPGAFLTPRRTDSSQLA